MQVRGPLCRRAAGAVARSEAARKLTKGGELGVGGNKRGRGIARAQTTNLHKGELRERQQLTTNQHCKARTSREQALPFRTA